MPTTQKQPWRQVDAFNLTKDRKNQKVAVVIVTAGGGLCRFVGPHDDDGFFYFKADRPGLADADTSLVRLAASRSDVGDMRLVKPVDETFKVGQSITYVGLRDQDCGCTSEVEQIYVID